MKRDDHNDRGRRRFRILVQGRLDERFAEGLDGVVQEDAADGTTLSGDLLDQSQLHGVLDHLRRLGVDVLRFEVDPSHRRQPSPGSPQTGEPDDRTRSEEGQ
jgi:hypothetical protein